MITSVEWVNALIWIVAATHLAAVVFIFIMVLRRILPAQAIRTGAEGLKRLNPVIYGKLERRVSLTPMVDDTDKLTVAYINAAGEQVALFHYKVTDGLYSDLETSTPLYIEWVRGDKADKLEAGMVFEVVDRKMPMIAYQVRIVETQSVVDGEKILALSPCDPMGNHDLYGAGAAPIPLARAARRYILGKCLRYPEQEEQEDMGGSTQSKLAKAEDRAEEAAKALRKFGQAALHAGDRLPSAGVLLTKDATQSLESTSIWSATLIKLSTASNISLDVNGSRSRKTVSPITEATVANLVNGGLYLIYNTTTNILRLYAYWGAAEVFAPVVLTESGTVIMVNPRRIKLSTISECSGFSLMDTCYTLGTTDMPDIGHIYAFNFPVGEGQDERIVPLYLFATPEDRSKLYFQRVTCTGQPKGEVTGLIPAEGTEYDFIDMGTPEQYRAATKTLS